MVDPWVGIILITSEGLGQKGQPNNSPSPAMIFLGGPVKGRPYESNQLSAHVSLKNWQIHYVFVISPYNGTGYSFRYPQGSRVGLAINHLSGPLHADTKEDKFLILSNTYNPNWSATIDQKFSPIFKTDYSLRSIYVSNGRRQINFSFHFYLFNIGLVLTSVCLLEVILLSFRTLSKTTMKKKVRSNDPKG